MEIERCAHGQAIVDGAGVRLTPACGCRKVEVSIGKQYDGDDIDMVRVNVSVGSQLVCRIDFRLSDFAQALMGLAGVPATYSSQRVKPRGKGA